MPMVDDTQHVSVSSTKKHLFQYSVEVDDIWLPFMLLHVNRGNAAVIELRWKAPGAATMTVVPVASLRPRWPPAIAAAMWIKPYETAGHMTLLSSNDAVLALQVRAE